MSTGSPLLRSLEQLLEAHGQAALAGDADALTACATQVRQHIAALARAPSAPTAADVPLLQALVRQCDRTQAFLARRQHDAERSLSALRAGLPDAAAAQPVYAAGGLLAAPAARGRGFGQA